MAAEGVHKLPAINGGRDLKEALQKLASIPSKKILVRMEFFFIQINGIYKNLCALMITA